MPAAPISLIIPTYNRGTAIFSVLEKVQLCDPQPSKIMVHIDLADGGLERELEKRFPEVRVLTSMTRLGPGGARHRCLEACTTPYAASFDDDSYPVDRDFFSKVEQLFQENSDVAILGASIWHRNEVEKARGRALTLAPNYVGCGYAIRLAAYRSMRNHLPLAIPYGMEENDLSLQLFAAGWKIMWSSELRVFHDSELTHHESHDITSAKISNVALFAFLHYPVLGWGWGLLQLANKVAYCIRRGRIGGISSGLFRIPSECYRYRRFRKPVSLQTMRSYLRFCKTGSPT